MMPFGTPHGSHGSHGSESTPFVRSAAHAPRSEPGPYPALDLHGRPIPSFAEPVRSPLDVPSRPAPTGLVERVRAFTGASAWTVVVLRAVFFLVALCVFAWIGRATAAPSGARGVEPADAGVPALPAPVDVPSAPPPVPPATVLIATPAPSTVMHASGGPARATPADPVYLNHASVEDLRRLPGVGAKRAEAILALRQRIGRFQRVEDLLRVKGVGRATVRKWRPLVRLDAPAAKDTPDAGTR